MEKGLLNWVYVGSNEINFSSKIKGNMMFVVKMEEEHIIKYVV
jgi:hypothetical protein